MKRIVLILVLVLGLCVVVVGPSRAQGIIVRKGVCLSLPDLTPVSCAFPTAIPVSPDKELAVKPSTLPNTEGVAGYTITITSRVACFPLDEPIDVYTLGNNGAAVLSPLSPTAGPLQKPDHYRVTVDKTGLARLALEVWTRIIGLGGLDVKAVWPVEGVERIQPVIAAPTVTGTVVATVVPTPTSTSTPVPAGTSGPAATPTAPATQFFVRVCVSPNPVGKATQATAYVQSLPGATCALSVTFSNGTAATELTGNEFQIPNTGVGGIPFTVNSAASSGTVTAACTFQGLSDTATASFLITPPTATPTAVP